MFRVFNFKPQTRRLNAGSLGKFLNPMFNKKPQGYVLYSTELLKKVIATQNLDVIDYSKSQMGEWWIKFENLEFIVVFEKDRGGFKSISIGSKKRIKPGAHLRGTWSIQHLKGFLENLETQAKFNTFGDQIAWLEENLDKLFDSALLNSDDLNKWSIQSSKTLFK